MKKGHIYRISKKLLDTIIRMLETIEVLQETKLKEKKNIYLNNLNNDSIELMKGVNDLIDLSNISVLIIDDNYLIQKTLSKKLKDIGINNITLASNGNEGLSKMLETKFSLVFLDISMPEMDGHECYSKMKSVLSKLPITICITVDKDNKEIDMDDIIYKPLEFDDIKEKVNKYFPNHFN